MHSLHTYLNGYPCRFLCVRHKTFNCTDGALLRCTSTVLNSYGTDMIPRFLRDALIRRTREDILCFIDEHQDDLLRYFRQEIEAVDQRIPEEQAFIDIHMAALGEELMKAVFAALRRFIQDY